jgi:pimeloyl-ACP methyl ester carboxylesterase
MATVVDGPIELWYEVRGEGVPLVLTGGFGLLDDQFHAVVDDLARRYTVVNWHYRGSGRSTRTGPDDTWSLDRWADDLELVLAEVGITDAVLWGTSTGSPISARYAGRHPERVRALVMHPFIRSTGGGRRVFDGFVTIAESFGYEALALFSAWIGCAGEHDLQPEMLELARFEAGSFRRNFALDELRAILAALDGIDVSDDLRRISVPVLALLGASGRMGAEQGGTARSIEELRSLVSHAEVAIVPGGGGTYCMIEQPQATVAALDAFIDRLPTRR